MIGSRLSARGISRRLPVPTSTVRTWLSGYTGSGINSSDSATWSASYYTPTALGGYVDFNGGYNDGQNGFSGLITALGQNPISGNQAYLAMSDANPSTAVSILTVGLIPHEVPFSSNPTSSTEITHMAAAAVSNADQSYWYQVGASLVRAGWNHRNMIIRLGHEPNGNWYPWSTNNDPTRMAYYQQAYTNAVIALRAGGATNVRFDFCMNANTGGLSAGGTIAGHYPGDAYVDVISIDWYNFNGYTTTSALNANQTLFPNFIDVPSFAANHGKQFAVGEWGVHPSALALSNGEIRDQPAVAQWMFQTLENVQAKYAHAQKFPYGFIAYDCYFDTTVTALANNPSTQAAYVQLWTGSSVSPTFVSSTPVDGTLGLAYTYQFSAAASPAAVYTVSSGTLPSGLSLSSSGLLSGTPLTSGIMSLTVTATNSVGHTDVAVSLNLAASTSTTNLVGNSTFDANAAGWSGIAAATSRVTTPTNNGAGALQVTASNASTDPQAAGPSINVTAGKVYQLSAYLRAATTSRTGYIQLNWQNSAGYLSTSQVGYYSITAAGWTQEHGTPVIAPAGATSAQVIVGIQQPVVVGELYYVDDVAVYQPTVPVITTTTLAAGTVNSTYSVTLAAVNSPTSWTLVSGSMPGITLNIATGVLSGTPTANGSYTLVVTASNANGSSTSVTLPATVVLANTNLVANPSFDNDVTGWSATNATVSYITNPVNTGTGAANLVANSAGTITLSSGYGSIAVLAGHTYLIAASFKAATSGRICYLQLNWINASYSYLSTSTAGYASTSTSIWTQESGTVTAPSGATMAQVIVGIQSALNGEIHYVDDVSVVQTS